MSWLDISKIKDPKAKQKSLDDWVQAVQFTAEERVYIGLGKSRGDFLHCIGHPDTEKLLNGEWKAPGDRYAD